MSDRSGLLPGDAITRGGRLFLVAWSVGLALLLAGAAWLAIVPVRNEALASTGRHRARMDPLAADPGATPPDLKLPPGACPTQVYAGIYVDRIVELSIKDASWTVDFYLWFRWRGDAVRPGEGIQVVDGWIESQQREEEHSQGDEQYERYRVVARITKPFSILRFPCDNHLLTINIENPRYGRHQVQFVPDQANSGVSSRVRVAAYAVRGAELIEKPHSYKTTRGDPRLTPGTKSTYSQCRLGIELRRDSWGFYFKMFQALYVAVTIAMLAMFVKPTNVDPRFGLGVGGLFAAVANSYVTSSLIPDTGVMTVADLVNGIGIGMILLTVVQSTVSLHLFERLGLEALSRRFDQVSFAVLASGYLAINIALPLAASVF
jgi:hypothetical protein